MILSINPKVKAHIITPEPKAIIAAIIFLLILNEVPIITPKINEKPAKNANNITFAIDINIYLILIIVII